MLTKTEESIKTFRSKTQETQHLWIRISTIVDKVRSVRLRINQGHSHRT